MALSLIEEAIDDKTLTDEIFMQIIKQASV